MYAQQICLPKNNNINIINNNNITLSIVKVIIMTCCFLKHSFSYSSPLMEQSSRGCMHSKFVCPENLNYWDSQGKQITGGARLLVHLYVNLAFCLALLIIFIDMLSQSSKLRSCLQLHCDFGSVILEFLEFISFSCCNKPSKTAVQWSKCGSMRPFLYILTAVCTWDSFWDVMYMYVGLPREIICIKPRRFAMNCLVNLDAIYIKLCLLCSHWKIVVSVSS